MTSGLLHKGSGLVDVSGSRGYTVLLLHALLDMSKLAFLKHFWRTHWFAFHSKMSWPGYLMIDQCRDAELPLCYIGVCIYKALLCVLGELRSNCTNDKSCHGGRGS